jgi:hypothetical protein
MNEILRHWFIEPLSAKMLIFYLTAVACVTIWRIGRLLRYLYPARNLMIISSQNVCDGTITAERLVQCALAGRMRLGLHDGDSKPNDKSKPVRRGITLQILGAAEAEFSYLWDRLFQSVQSTKRIIVLTLLLSLFVTVRGISSIMDGRYMISNDRMPQSVLLQENVVEMFGILSLSLCFCVFLSLVWTICEGVLRRRRASWIHFCARFKNDAQE